MNRIIHIFLSITLVLATTGLSISKHYCGNSVVRTNLGIKADSCMPDMEMGHGCCDDQTQTLILDDDFQVSYSSFNIIPEYDLLISYLANAIGFVSEYSNFQSFAAFTTGPHPGAEPLYVKVQSFLL